MPTVVPVNFLCAKSYDFLTAFSTCSHWRHERTISHWNNLLIGPRYPVSELSSSLGWSFPPFSQLLLYPTNASFLWDPRLAFLLPVLFPLISSLHLSYETQTPSELSWALNKMHPNWTHSLPHSPKLFILCCLLWLTVIKLGSWKLSLIPGLVSVSGRHSHNFLCLPVPVPQPGNMPWLLPLGPCCKLFIALLGPPISSFSFISLLSIWFMFLKYNLTCICLKIPPIFSHLPESDVLVCWLTFYCP